MAFGNDMMLLRTIGFCEAELGKLIGASGGMIGRYEHNDISPSTEVFVKIADVLEVLVDHVISETKMEIDKSTMRRPEPISTLLKENRSFLFILIDMALGDFKTKKSNAK